VGQVATLLTGAALLLGAGAAAFSLHLRARSRERLWDATPPEAEEAGSRSAATRLAGWLSLAGIRGAGASERFVAVCLGVAAAGIALAWALGRSPAFVGAAHGLAGLPVVGLPLARLALWLPWLGGLVLALLPALTVRARRERRVADVESDLPLVLELLATLGEAGLGFDAALDRVLDSEPAGRPLAQELRTYQNEVLAGCSRREGLLRLARRLEVPTVTSAVAALVQAEDTGSGLAEVLRPLADDLRQRRRERALARAEALSEKLVFPLVIGFLPALLVWTLGPSFYQLFGVVDSIMRGAP